MQPNAATMITTAMIWDPIPGKIACNIAAATRAKSLW